MTFFTLKDLKIKLVDFINLLSPLGVVKKIVSNGEQHLFEIYFHNSLIIENSDEHNNYMNNSILKLYYDVNLGNIVNEKLCILEIPNGINTNDKYFRNCKNKDKETISKFLRKNIPKDCHNILKNNIKIKNKITNPDKINISNLNGYQRVLV